MWGWRGAFAVGIAVPGPFMLLEARAWIAFALLAIAGIVSISVAARGAGVDSDEDGVDLQTLRFRSPTLHRLHGFFVGLLVGPLGSLALARLAENAMGVTVPG